MPRMASPPPGGVAPVPDVPNWTWHEYGMRVGIWRLMEVLRHRGIRPTVSLNAKVCETRPRVARAALDDGWEFMAHRSEEHTSELQSLMRISYAVFCLKK